MTHPPSKAGPTPSSTPPSSEPLPPALVDPSIVEDLADRLRDDGFAVIPDALPNVALCALERLATDRPDHEFDPGGIGRAADGRVHEHVRSDRVIWIDPDGDATRWFLDWAESLRSELNRRLYLGLVDYECHLAWYPVGSFYRRHLDAFEGTAESRRLSTVLYLNRAWSPGDGGELVIHRPDGESTTVAPTFGTFVAFLSDEFPHEVLPTAVSRHSIAGWFRGR